MAVITKFEKEQRQPTLHPTYVICGWAIASSAEGGPLLQLTTYGSASRENPGKVSQTVQLTKESAGMLFDILKREFRFN